jgi:hypothetical protein
MRPDYEGFRDGLVRKRRKSSVQCLEQRRAIGAKPRAGGEGCDARPAVRFGAEYVRRRQVNDDEGTERRRCACDDSTALGASERIRGAFAN